MKKLITPILIALLITSCGRIKHQAVGVKLQSLLFNSSANDYLNISVFDTHLQKEFQKFEVVNEKTNEIIKFDKGLYIMKLVEKESYLYAKKYAHNAQGRMVETTHLENNPNTDNVNVKKMMYLTFIDNQRLILYAPTDNQTIRTGEKILERDLNPYYKNKFVRQTDNYFKINFFKDYNRVLKGYYKINSNNEMLICLDNGFKNNKTDLIGYQCKIDNDGKKISIQKAYSKDEFFDIVLDSLFQFNYQPQPQTLLYVNNRDFYRINKIDYNGNNLQYHIAEDIAFKSFEVLKNGELQKITIKK